jgi:outer membrane immunogenic protein
MHKWIGIPLLLIAALPALAQSRSGEAPPVLDVSVGYTLARVNASGGCGCFWMNGGAAATSLSLTKSFSVVADFAAFRNGNVQSTSQSLMLISYMFGPRFTYRNHSGLTPFAQLLAGGAHASGLGYSGPAGPAFALAAAAGGGLNLRVNRRVEVRLFEAEYFMTHFQNGVNSRESALRVSFGLVFPFGRQ